jgi:polyhydroxybutyrate depolymerase
MKVKIRTILSLVILAAAAQAVAAQGTVMTWTIDGVKRQALVFAPAPATANNTVRNPLVFAWHGHGGNMQGTSQLMHIQTVWPEAIVVYPQGVTGRPSPVDPNGNKPGWQVEANQSGGVGNQDLKFFDAMVSSLQQQYTIDDRRIYTTGFSNGGIFSYLLWAERAKTIAAIGEVAGRLWDTEHITEPRPILAIAGHQDTTDPFALQEASIKQAQTADSAPDPGQQCVAPSGSAPHTECTFYPSTTQTPVKKFIHPGAHVYPPWAPAEIVKFFKNHHL